MSRYLEEETRTAAVLTTNRGELCKRRSCEIDRMDLHNNNIINAYRDHLL